DLGQESRTLRAIGDAMIGGKRDLHHLSHYDSAFAHDRLIGQPADAEDCGLRRLDDRDQRLDAESAEIRDGKRAGVEFLWPQRSALRPRDEVFRLSRKLPQRL